MILSLNKYNPKDYPVIAIDLDDTIWSSHNPDGTHIFPNAGMPYKNAIKTINNMICAGYEVIIWTARDSAEQATACKNDCLKQELILILSGTGTRIEVPLNLL